MFLYFLIVNWLEIIENGFDLIKLYMILSFLRNNMPLDIIVSCQWFYWALYEFSLCNSWIWYEIFTMIYESWFWQQWDPWEFPYKTPSALECLDFDIYYYCYGLEEWGGFCLRSIRGVWYLICDIWYLLRDLGFDLDLCSKGIWP